MVYDSRLKNFQKRMMISGGELMRQVARKKTVSYRTDLKKVTGFLAGKLEIVAQYTVMFGRVVLLTFPKKMQ